MHQQATPLPGAPFVVELTGERRPVPAVPQQGLYGKVVGFDDARVALADVGHPGFGPLWLPFADVEDLGPAEDVRAHYPDLWKSRWAGSRRLVVPFRAYWDWVAAELRKTR